MNHPPSTQMKLKLIALLLLCSAPCFAAEAETTSQNSKPTRRKLLELLVLGGIPLMAMGAMSPRAGVIAAGRRAASGGGSPAFGAEVTRTSGAFSSSATQVFTLTGGIASGKRAVIVILYDDTGPTVSSVADSRGNTYAVHVHSTSSQVKSAIVSSAVTTALLSGDTITATFSSGVGMWRGAIILYLDGTSAFDVSGTYSDFTNTASASLTPTATAVIVSAIATNDAGMTTSSVNGTQSGATYSWGGGGAVLIYKTVASAGATTIGATFTATYNVRQSAAAFK